MSCGSSRENAFSHVILSGATEGAVCGQAAVVTSGESAAEGFMAMVIQFPFDLVVCVVAKPTSAGQRRMERRRGPCGRRRLVAWP